MREELATTFPSALLETVVHPTIRVREAAEMGVPVMEHDPDSRAARDFQDLAREMSDLEVDLPAVAIDHWTALLEGPDLTPDGVRFVAEFPRAQEVRLTGSFNDWSVTGTPLYRREDGRWECVMPIPAGDHEYRYIVDGKWLPDPHNESSVVNEFGGSNSLVAVP